MTKRLLSLPGWAGKRSFFSEFLLKRNMIKETIAAVASGISMSIHIKTHPL